MMKLIGHRGFVLTLALLLGGSGAAWAEDFYKGFIALAVMRVTGHSHLQQEY